MTHDTPPLSIFTIFTQGDSLLENDSVSNQHKGEWSSKIWSSNSLIASSTLTLLVEMHNWDINETADIEITVTEILQKDCYSMWKWTSFLLNRFPCWPCRVNLHVAFMHADKLLEKQGKFRHLAWNFQRENSCEKKIVQEFCLQYGRFSQNFHAKVKGNENLIWHKILSTISIQQSSNSYLLNFQQILKHKSNFSTLWRKFVTIENT